MVEGEALLVGQPEDRRDPGPLDERAEVAPLRRVVHARQRDALPFQGERRREINRLSGGELDVHAIDRDPEGTRRPRGRAPDDASLARVERLALGAHQRDDVAGQVDLARANQHEEEARMEQRESQEREPVLHAPDHPLSHEHRPIPHAREELRRVLGRNGRRRLERHRVAEHRPELRIGRGREPHSPHRRAEPVDEHGDEVQEQPHQRRGERRAGREVAEARGHEDEPSNRSGTHRGLVGAGIDGALGKHDVREQQHREGCEKDGGGPQGHQQLPAGAHVNAPLPWPRGARCPTKRPAISPVVA